MRTLHRADLGWPLLRSALGARAKAQLAPSVQPSNQARRHSYTRASRPGLPTSPWPNPPSIPWRATPLESASLETRCEWRHEVKGVPNRSLSTIASRLDLPIGRVRASWLAPAPTMSSDFRRRLLPRRCRHVLIVGSCVGYPAVARAALGRIPSITGNFAAAPRVLTRRLPVDWTLAGHTAGPSGYRSSPSARF